MADLLILDDAGDIREDTRARLGSLPLVGGLCISISCFEDADGNEVIEIRRDGVLTKRVETGRPRVSMWNRFFGGRT